MNLEYYCVRRFHLNNGTLKKKHKNMCVCLWVTPLQAYYTRASLYNYVTVTLLALHVARLLKTLGFFRSMAARGTIYSNFIYMYFLCF